MHSRRSKVLLPQKASLTGATKHLEINRDGNRTMNSKIEDEDGGAAHEIVTDLTLMLTLSDLEGPGFAEGAHLLMD